MCLSVLLATKPRQCSSVTYISPMSADMVSLEDHGMLKPVQDRECRSGMLHSGCRATAVLIAYQLCLSKHTWRVTSLWVF
jgi:hypothetical protein